MFSSVTMESFITVVVMNCRGLDLFKQRHVEPFSGKMYSIVTLRIWAFLQTFMFSLPKRKV